MHEDYYAAALEQAIARGTEPALAVRRLRESLEKAGRTKLLPKIARALARMRRRVERSRGIELVIAREGDKAKALSEAGAISGRDVGAASIRIDDALIGGWILSTMDTRIDASHRKHLTDLYRNITA